MPRRRVAVALLPPAPLARAVQTLRRAVDDPRLGELPPHLTLVPPVNVTDEGFVDGRALLRSVASTSAAFELLVGPASTFAPTTPTLHLELQGDTGSLRHLRAAVRTGPFGRPDVWPFHPHVTLREQLGDPAPELAAELLSGDLGPWLVDRLHLLEQRRDGAGRRCWVPVAEEAIAAPAVVGRGGVELELRTTTMVPEEAASLTDGATPPADPFVEGLVVTASRPGAHPCDPPLGLVTGHLSGGAAGSRVAALRCAVVDPAERGSGIGRHLLRRWCHEAALRGADLAIAGGTTDGPTDGTIDGPTDDSTVGLLDAEGFVAVGTTRVRQLVSE